MGIFDRLKKFFRPDPYTPDYSGWSDKDLQQRWASRMDLTPQAHKQLHHEMVARRLLAETSVDDDGAQPDAEPAPEMLEVWTFADHPEDAAAEVDEPFMTLNADGSVLLGSGASGVMFGGPQSDDDGRPRSFDGLEVARRLLEASHVGPLAMPAYTFVGACP